jgi:CRISPR system Cascade subunit CasB
MTPMRRGEIAAQWWRELAEPSNARARGAGRAALARLRRARNATDALMEPATIDLGRRLGMLSSDRLERVGMVAAVLAHVRTGSGQRVARACGPTSPNDADDGKLKYGRFRRLLQADDEDLIDQMRRLVHLLGQQANVDDLADSILWWGDKVRQRWALDYYGVDRQPEAPSAPV